MLMWVLIACKHVLVLNCMHDELEHLLNTKHRYGSALQDAPPRPGVKDPPKMA